MKRYVHASRNCYDDLVRRKDFDPEVYDEDDEYVPLGYVTMTGVETLDIFEDDDATVEELGDALVDYVDEYFIISDEQREWVRNSAAIDEE